jgi:hypothetical protein
VDFDVHANVSLVRCELLAVKCTVLISVSTAYGIVDCPFCRVNRIAEFLIAIQKAFTTGFSVYFVQKSFAFSTGTWTCPVIASAGNIVATYFNPT